MNKEVEKSLKNAGWFSKRKFNISKYIEFLAADGYELNNTIKAFLEEFGGLRIFFSDSNNINHTDNILFDAKYAAEGIFPENIKLYEKRVNDKLVVIGYVYDEHMVVVMSHKGKIYAGYDDTLVFLGDTGLVAIENVCLGKEPVPIPL